MSMKSRDMRSHMIGEMIGTSAETQANIDQHDSEFSTEFLKMAELQEKVAAALVELNTYSSALSRKVDELRAKQRGRSPFEFLGVIPERSTEPQTPPVTGSGWGVVTVEQLRREIFQSIERFSLANPDEPPQTVTSILVGTLWGFVGLAEDTVTDRDGSNRDAAVEIAEEIWTKAKEHILYKVWRHPLPPLTEPTQPLGSKEDRNDPVPTGT